MRKPYFFLSGMFLLAVPAAFSQIMYSNGAVVHIMNGATVIANGGVHVSNASALTNDGSLIITKNSTLPLAGSFDLSNAAVVDGNGLYRVEQDWINDATFNAGSSDVELYGNTQQFITSTTGVVTTFNDLALTGTGTGNNRKKTLQGVNANTGTSGTLAINDRELETQTNTFFVLNPSAAAVSNTTTPGSEGFVSSASPGTFSRVTNTNVAYIFPTGSSNGTLRYRPVEMTPTLAASDVYTARLNNTDPNTDGFSRANNDGSMCLINSLYYHSIDHTSGTTPSDIRLFYIAGADGNWAGMGHWRNASTDWNDMSTVTASTSGAFSTLNRAAWAFANPGHPYALTNIRPAQPSFTCPALCENSSGNIFNLTGTASSYQWSVPAGSSITSGQGSSSITVNWGTGTGNVSVYAVGSPGCNSLPATCQPTVFQSPVAQFTANSSSTGNFNDSYTFTDISTNGGTIWEWNFGDGGTANTQNTAHQYTGAGTYTVVLEVSNAGGCSDTASFVITTDEGISIPNVFSPNGDGVNDEFFVSSSNLKEYMLDIFNRWGELMFHSENKTEVWKGTTLNGKDCPNGSYFFVLKATSGTKDYSTSGYISLTGAK